MLIKDKVVLSRAAVMAALSDLRAYERSLSARHCTKAATAVELTIQAIGYTIYEGQAAEQSALACSWLSQIMEETKASYELKNQIASRIVYYEERERKGEG